MEKIRWKVEYTEGVEDKLSKLPKTILRFIKSAIESKLAIDPVAFGKPLRYSLKGHRRLRVGDYRIIYRIIEEKVVVFVVDVDHRKDVYDR